MANNLPPIYPVSDVLQCTYADLKTVKSRSMCQLVLELPIEALPQVVALLGAPIPSETVWVAVARLRSQAEPEQIEPPRKTSLAQSAGIICSEPAFWKYVNVSNEAEAAEYVRGHCGVSTRSALDSNDDAALAFRTLRTDYKLWLDGIDGAAA